MREGSTAKLSVLAAISGILGALACARPTLWIGGAEQSDLSGARPAGPAQVEAGALGNPLAGRDAPEPARAGAAAGAHASPMLDAGAGGDATTDAGAGIAGAHSPAAGSGGTMVPSPDRELEDAGTEDPPTPTRLPVDMPRCPVLSGPGTYTFGDPGRRTLSARIYIAPDARTKPAPGGPLIMYFHGFGSDPSEVLSGLGQEAIDSVVAAGGVVAAFGSKLCTTCGLPDDVAWYVEDDAVSDHVVACAVAQANIDTRRIHAMGFSAGGMHSLHLALARSNYLASVMSYSGGASDLSKGQGQDPTNRVAAMLAFGSAERDVFAINFNTASIEWWQTRTPLGWYAMLCHHGGGHFVQRELGPHVYRFFRDHPYKVDPEPYAKMIPSSFPAYCSNMPPAR